MNNYLSFIYQNKKLFILFASLITLIIILVLVSLLQKDKPLLQPPKPITFFQPSATPSSTFIPQSDYKKIIAKDVKDLHWLGNNELSYTFFDHSIKQRVLAKTDLTNNNETALIKDSALKMSELYWSSKNLLIIFDYGTSYNAYLFNYNTNKITKLSFNGYGYSWSPDSNLIFFYDLNNNPPVPKIYDIQTNSFVAVNIPNPPAFVASYWSPDTNHILLYNFNLETGAGEGNILNQPANSITRIQTDNILFPSWSPLGDQLVYVANDGIYLQTINNNPSLIYSTDTNPQFISYAWVDNNNLFVFDSAKNNDPFLLIAVKTNSKRAVLKEINPQTNQRMQLATSTDSNSAAIALEKDGLWIIKKSLLYK